jgi:ABC-type multidrug transport system fused ATPase/permease subunit
MTSDIPSKTSTRERVSYRFFLARAREEAGLYGGAFIFIIATNILETWWVRLSAVAVETVAAGGAVIGAALWLVLLAFVIFALRWINRNLVFLAGRRLERRIRSAAYASALALPEEEFDRHRTGDLVSRIVNDVSDIRMVLGAGFLQLTNNIVAYATTIAAMLWLVPGLAVAALLPFVPLWLLAKYLTAVTHERSRISQEAVGRLSASIEETVSGIEVIKSYTADGWQRDRFAAANEGHRAAETARIVPESIFGSIMGNSVWIGVASILLGGGWILRNGGGVSIGDFTTFVFLFARLVWPTAALGWIMNVIQRGLSAAARLEPFLVKRAGTALSRSVSEEVAGLGAKTAPAARGELRFNAVSFRYPTRHSDSIRDLALTIEPGSWVGIVGPTASGKTTIARLASGLRRPTAGSVRAAGRPPADLSASDRRRLVHLATQTPTLFSISIRDNLQLAVDRKVADDEMISILKDAAFGPELRRMPEGLSTELGERGLLLSGGQRQRLSLARGLLADPEILVLDDVLSAVDLETELQLLDGIGRRRAGRTTIFITHRLRVLGRLERVLVVEDGRISADGTLGTAAAASMWLRATIEADRLKASLVEG